MELAVVAGFQAVLLALFVFLYTRLGNRIERRIDSLAHDVSELRTRDLPAVLAEGNRHAAELRKDLAEEAASLRKDLAEEFRAQRAEVSAQVTAIATAISASKG
jgi:5'-deoxynucleotidase YfbR-like HD superfamily hydrolase